ncbi:MAG: hypothetical protein ABI543_10190 [Ignavibacteria bacterium]
MEYKEFLKQPEIESKFQSMLTEQKEYYLTKRYIQDFDKVHRELMSIKMAFLATDLYFTNIHKTNNEK